MLKNSWLYFKHEYTIELRQMSGLYGILLYILATIFIIKQTFIQLDRATLTQLFWLLQLFTCVQVVSKNNHLNSHLKQNYIYTLINSSTYIWAKIIITITLMTILSIINLSLFKFFMPIPFFDNPTYSILLIMGSISLGILFTFINAFALHINTHSSLLIIIGFPISIPLFIILSNLTQTVFLKQNTNYWYFIKLTLGYNVLILVLINILFPLLWEDA
ncbi:MAG: heme exporter protein CcmB [Alphaproteobacteria bacterium]|nr:heme exporter protein CcmB [Alphaproteobacteria bacterium]